MDSTSRGKLVRAGYKIFRSRDVYPVTSADPSTATPSKPTYQIREMSDRGDWVLYGKYPTKAAREREWKLLAADEKHIMDSDGSYDAAIEAAPPPPAMDSPVMVKWRAYSAAIEAAPPSPPPPAPSPPVITAAPPPPIRRRPKAGKIDPNQPEIPYA